MPRRYGEFMAQPSRDLFRVTLLGSGAPPPRLDRFGPSTLIEVGNEKFIVDAGRGAMQRIYQLGIPFAEITGLFLTHHHSDHVVGFPDLWLTGWIGRPWGKRNQPLHVWGPVGTQQMMEHLPLAFAVDIRVRGRNYPPDGVKLLAHEIKEGVVLDRDGIRVSAFEVDHGGVADYGVSFANLAHFDRVRQVNWLLFLLAFCWMAPNTQQILASHRPALVTPGYGTIEPVRVLAWRPSLSWVAFILVLGIIALLSIHRYSEFIYFRF